MRTQTKSQQLLEGIIQSHPGIDLIEQEFPFHPPFINILLSFPNIPNVTPSITLSREEAVNLLLASIAFEELGLAHVINAEAEKIQAAVGTLPESDVAATTISELLAINESANSVLKTALKQQMLLQFKMEDVLDIVTETTTTTAPVILPM